MMDAERVVHPRTVRPGVVAAGLIVVTVGALMLLDTTGWVDVPLRRLIAPFVLIALGAAISLEKRGGGLWLIGIGSWMMLVQTHAFGFDSHNSWPLLVIMSGLAMLVRGLR
jgi:hypothetical protein